MSKVVVLYGKFNGKFNVTLNLQSMLIDISLRANQTMNACLDYIKTITDVLATIQSPIFDLELIQLTIVGLLKDYDSFVPMFSMLL